MWNLKVDHGELKHPQHGVVFDCSVMYLLPLLPLTSGSVRFDHDVSRFLPAGFLLTPSVN